MGCAIGMSVAAACEIIYWLTLKPVAKLMANVTLTARAKYIYEKIFLLVLLSLFTFSFYQFRNVYLTAISRSYDLNTVTDSTIMEMDAMETTTITMLDLSAIDPTIASKETSSPTITALTTMPDLDPTTASMDTSSTIAQTLTTTTITSSSTTPTTKSKEILDPNGSNWGFCLLKVTLWFC